MTRHRGADLTRVVLMTTDIKPTTQRVAFDVLMAHDRGLLDRVLTPELVGSLPDAGVVPTRESLERALVGLKAKFPHLVYTLDEGIGRGDQVAHCLSMTGTVKGDFVWASRTWSTEQARSSPIPGDVVMRVVV
jgi:hypothetical protein